MQRKKPIGKSGRHILELPDMSGVISGLAMIAVSSYWPRFGVLRV